MEEPTAPPPTMATSYVFVGEEEEDEMEEEERVAVVGSFDGMYECVRKGGA
jgi:hypothetical protein